MEKYIFPFLIALVLSEVFSVVALKVAGKIKWQGRASSRHIHNKKKTFRVGGIAMVLAFVLTISFNKELCMTPELVGVMLASLVLMIFGFRDDLRELFWKIQLFFQMAVAVLVFVMGVRIYYITNPFVNGGIIKMDQGIGIVFSVLLVIFWITLMMNVMNWIDGIDGLSGGVSLISAITIFILSLKPEVNQPSVAIITAIFAGAVLGFLILNFYPSRIMAGTSGSLFMGFALASISIFSGTKIATALLVMAIPTIDFVWVIWERFRAGRSILKADQNHLHHKLLKLGWSQKKISLVFYVVTFLIAIIALNTRAIGKGITMFLAVSFMLAFMIFLRKKLRMKERDRDLLSLEK